MHRTTRYCLIWLCCAALLGGCERRQHLVQQHLLEFGTIIEITMNCGANAPNGMHGKTAI